MQDPIQRLLQEHRAIMRQVAELRSAVQTLADRSENALPGVLPVLQVTVRMIESELLAHARREDDALFPAIERTLNDSALTGQMRQEHRDIHAEGDRFRSTLREINEVEHPAIVAGGALLKTLVATGGSAEALRRTGAKLIRLLDDHFRKEEEILFPMAREVLQPDQLEAIARAMEAIK